MSKACLLPKLEVATDGKFLFKLNNKVVTPERFFASAPKWSASECMIQTQRANLLNAVATMEFEGKCQDADCVIDEYLQACPDDSKCNGYFKYSNQQLIKMMMKQQQALKNLVPSKPASLGGFVFGSGLTSSKDVAEAQKALQESEGMLKNIFGEQRMQQAEINRRLKNEASLKVKLQSCQSSERMLNQMNSTYFQQINSLMAKLDKYKEHIEHLSKDKVQLPETVVELQEALKVMNEETKKYKKQATDCAALAAQLELKVKELEKTGGVIQTAVDVCFSSEPEARNCIRKIRDKFPDIVALVLGEDRMLQGVISADGVLNLLPYDLQISSLFHDAQIPATMEIQGKPIKISLIPIKPEDIPLYDKFGKVDSDDIDDCIEEGGRWNFNKMECMTKEEYDKYMADNARIEHAMFNKYLDWKEKKLASYMEPEDWNRCKSNIKKYGRSVLMYENCEFKTPEEEAQAKVMFTIAAPKPEETMIPVAAVIPAPPALVTGIASVVPASPAFGIPSAPSAPPLVPVAPSAPVAPVAPLDLQEAIKKGAKLRVAPQLPKEKSAEEAHLGAIREGTSLASKPSIDCEVRQKKRYNRATRECTNWKESEKKQAERCWKQGKRFDWQDNKDCVDWNDSEIDLIRQMGLEVDAGFVVPAESGQVVVAQPEAQEVEQAPEQLDSFLAKAMSSRAARLYEQGSDDEEDDDWD